MHFSSRAVVSVVFIGLSLTACSVEREGLGVSDLGTARFDAGRDASPQDAGDAEPVDLGASELGPNDLGPSDLGPRDLGPTDLGSVDSGPPDLGIPPCNPDACPGRLCATATTCGYARSCAELLAAGRTTSAVYRLQAADATLYDAHCELTAAGGGWTLAAKVDGTLGTFTYASALWTDATLMETSADTSSVEAKLRSFLDLPFTAIRLVFRTGGEEHEVVLTLGGSSLQTLFGTGTYTATTVGRAAWLGVIPGAHLQLYCDREGANTTPVPELATRAAVRLGIISNENAVGDCGSPNSFIGVGARYELAGWPSAGNYATGNTATGASGDANIPSFVLVYVR
jgi:hypothetical protein